MRLFFENILSECTDEYFLKSVLRKYHYDKEALEVLSEVAKQMQTSMREEAGWEASTLLEERDVPPEISVVMTLGAGVDRLQERYLEQGLLSEAYMVETIASDLLLSGYSAFNRWVEKHTPYRVERYYFLGSEEKYTLTDLPDILEKLQVGVRCNEAYCMIPKKSVAFVAKLTTDQDALCAGICMQCKNQNCTNRLQQVQAAWPADMTDRPLPYGYARIFGKET